MRAGVGGGATDTTHATGGSAIGHSAEVGDAHAAVVVNDVGALVHHVPDAVVAVGDEAVVRVRRAGQGEGVLGAGDAVEVVVLEELGVAALVPAGHRRAGPLVADGLDVRDAVELVGEVKELRVES